MKHLIAPSVLAADFTRLQEEFDMVNNSEADWFHLDVMDGIFVPNISYGFPVIKAMQEMAKKPLDVHLMIADPGLYIEKFREHGAEVITVHYEACTHLHRVLHQIRETGAKAGVAINPHTPVNLLEDVLEDIDLVCVMSVNPGFGGQKFIYRTLHKVKALREMITVRNTRTLIEVDGGVGLQNAEKILQAGADVLVAGSSVFKSDNPTESISRLKAIGKQTWSV